MLRNIWLLQLLLSLLPYFLFPNSEASPTTKAATRVLLAAHLSPTDSFLSRESTKITDEKGQPSSNNDTPAGGLCNCGYSNRGDMEIFWTEHDQQPQPVVKINYIASNKALGGDLSAIRWELDMSKVLGSGGSSDVHHAELSIKMDDDRIVHRCVALKLTKIYGSEEETAQRREWNILEAFGGLPDQQTRRHVVAMLAHGEYKNKKLSSWGQESIYLVTILELGTGGDYQKHLEKKYEADKRNGKRISEPLIVERIWDVLLVARNVHQKAMHLDFKPANLIYVPSEDGTKPPVLKAIDFGSSELIDAPKNSGEVGRQANSCKMMPDHNRRTTKAYESPEHRYQCYQHLSPTQLIGVELPKLSTKADIWAVGITIYQIAMMDPGNGIYKDKSYPFFHSQVLETISIFHTTANVREELLDKWEVDEEEKRSALALILAMRLKFPRIGLLLLAVLDSIPTARPTANGNLHFLKRQCHLGNVGLKDTFTGGILPFLDFGLLRAFLEKRDKQMLSTLNAIMDRDLNEQFDELNNLKITAKDGQPLHACDTHTNGVPSAEVSIERTAEENGEKVRPAAAPAI